MAAPVSRGRLTAVPTVSLVSRMEALTAAPTPAVWV